MDIEKRISEIEKYFESFDIVKVEGEGKSELVAYINLSLPSKWVIGDETREKYGVDYKSNNFGRPGEMNEICFFSDYSNGLEKLFDAVSYNVDNNIIAEKKMAILKNKIEGLKEMFEDDKYTIDNLESIKFECGEFKKHEPFMGKIVHDDIQKKKDEPKPVQDNTKNESKKK